MNSIRRVLLVTCVAVALPLASGCGSAPSGNTSSASSKSGNPTSTVDLKDLLSRNVGGVDKIHDLATIEETAPMVEAAKRLGLSHIYSPTSAAMRDKHIVGVAPFGKRCVVLFSPPVDGSVNGKIAAMVASRYSNLVMVVDARGPQPLDGIVPFLVKWAPDCEAVVATKAPTKTKAPTA